MSSHTMGPLARTPTAGWMTGTCSGPDCAKEVPAAPTAKPAAAPANNFRRVILSPHDMMCDGLVTCDDFRQKSIARVSSAREPRVPADHTGLPASPEVRSD